MPAGVRERQTSVPVLSLYKVDNLSSNKTAFKNRSIYQCCGSEFIFVGFGFTNFFSDSDP
jgi:hypothetical protein